MKSAILILSLLLANAALAGDTPAAALGKGVVQEEVDRDLNAAIKTYQSVAVRAKEDRQAAATAQFRIAECYRKLGKTGEAFAAYSHVVNDFADQKKLAEDSRIRLADMAGQPADHPAPPNQAEALNRFRGQLERGIWIARAYVDFVKQQVSLGAIRERDTYDQQAAVPRLEAQLSAFDAGLFPKQPASPRTAQAQKARQDYRKSLLTAVEFAGKNYTAALVNFKLGISQQSDVLRASFKQMDVEAQLAAFDAGLSYTPVAGALAP